MEKIEQERKLSLLDVVGSHPDPEHRNRAHETLRPGPGGGGGGANPSWLSLDIDPARNKSSLHP